MEKTCLNCGRTFKGSKRRKYCSMECYWMHYWKCKYELYKRLYVEIEPKVFFLGAERVKDEHHDGYFYRFEALEHVKPWRKATYFTRRKLSIDEVMRDNDIQKYLKD